MREKGGIFKLRKKSCIARFVLIDRFRLRMYLQRRVRKAFDPNGIGLYLFPSRLYNSKISLLLSIRNKTRTNSFCIFKADFFIRGFMRFEHLPGTFCYHAYLLWMKSWWWQCFSFFIEQIFFLWVFCFWCTWYLLLPCRISGIGNQWMKSYTVVPPNSRDS